MNFKWIVFCLLVSVNVLSADNTCVTCNLKNVSGMPSLNNFNQIEKVAVKTSEIALAPIGKLYEYCGKFESASNFKTIEPLIDTIVKDGYSAEESLSRCECLPKIINSIKNRLPMVQLIAEDVFGRYNFPKDIYEYFDRRGTPESWVKVINAQNTKGMTLLDYVKYIYEKAKDSYDDETKTKFKEIFSYICDRKGEMAYYKGANCKSGL